MVDLDDVISFPKWLIAGLLRALWWLAWDFCVQTVGWSIGWLFLRICTFGKFPEEGLGEADRAGHVHALLVELVGLVILAAAIWWLTSEWPSL
jgi:hypothetical protein